MVAAPMPQAPRTFLFDLDGTLIDHFAVIHRCYAHMMRELGRPIPSPAQVRAAVGGGLEHAMLRFVGEADLPRALQIYREYFDLTMLDGVILLPGAREFLEGLRARGAVSGVLTNKYGIASRRICEYLGLKPLLGAVVGAKDTAWLKPQRELTEHTLALLGGSADGAIMVGDSPFDIETAHNAGFPAWCVTTGTHDAAELRSAKADAVYPDLNALREAVLKAP
jgi:phosphoglycolate phosphatase-like HAD superfamily hydrolase